MKVSRWGQAPREVRGDLEWVMKVTDELGQRQKGCHSVEEWKAATAVDGDGRQLQGTKRKIECVNL